MIFFVCVIICGENFCRVVGVMTIRPRVLEDADQAYAPCQLDLEVCLYLQFVDCAVDLLCERGGCSRV